MAKEVLHQLDVIALISGLSGSFVTDYMSKTCTMCCLQRLHAIVLYMLLGMNLYTIGPSSGADVVGITVDGNSITLPREELLQSLQLSSGECSISYRNTICAFKLLLLLLLLYCS